MSECHCGKYAEPYDYLCRRCRELTDGSDHPLAGRQIVSFIQREGMGGSVAYLDDGSELHAVYLRHDRPE